MAGGGQGPESEEVDPSPGELDGKTDVSRCRSQS